MAMLCRLFREAGHTVAHLAAEGSCGACDLAPVREADAVLLPLPASRDGIYPTAAKGSNPPALSDIFAAAKPSCLFLGGQPSPAVRAAADGEIIDYYTGEELVRRGAAATAEAAVAMASLDLPVTLAGTHFAILGAGRIAMHILTLLQAAGARISLFARAPAARERAAARGADVYPIEAGVAPTIPPDVRAVFSTVPAMLFPAGGPMPPRGSYFYDLGVGAIDRTAAEAAGVSLPPSAGLPGKYSPESSAAWLFERITRILSAEGVEA